MMTLDYCPGHDTPVTRTPYYCEGCEVSPRVTTEPTVVLPHGDRRHIDDSDDAGVGTTRCGMVIPHHNPYVVFHPADPDGTTISCDYCVDADADACDGHPADTHDPMGVTVYCDGSCR